MQNHCNYLNLISPGGKFHKPLSVFRIWLVRLHERALQKKIDVAGTNARLAGIGALVEEEQVQIQTGMRDLRVGNPARSGGDALARLAVLRAYAAR